MFVPDPSRLFPRRSLPIPSHSRVSLAAGLLGLGGFVLAIVGAAVAGGLAYNFLWHWLCVPAGLLGFSIMINVCGEGPVILSGIVQAIFYSGVTFVFTDGLERADPTPSWIGAVAVAALFLWAARAASRERRDG